MEIKKVAVDLCLSPLRNHWSRSVRTLLVLLGALAGLTEAQAYTNKTYSPPPNIYVRPGGTSYWWNFGTGTTPNPSFPGPHPVVSVGYYNVNAFGWIVTRGNFQYSSNNGASWIPYTVGSSPTYVSNTNIWRFVDTTTLASPSTNNSFGCSWNLQSAGSSVASGGNLIIDLPPTNIVCDKSTILSSAVQGNLVATLTPGDTGAGTDGRWVIDSQSVANLFTLDNDPTTENTARVKIGTGTLPVVGQTATITARYHDLYQVSSNGVPNAGQGTNKTFTFTVVAEATTNLNFTTDIFVNTYTNDNQQNPAVATLSDGSLVAVWQSAGQGGKTNGYHGIYGQRLSNTGTKVGGEFLISNGGTNVDEMTPVVTPLNNGRFAVAYATWRGTNYDIGFRLVETNGTVGSEVIANATTAGEQTSPALARLTNGVLAVAWYSDNGNLVVRQFNSTNGSVVSAETTVVSGTAYLADLTALDNGSYATAWIDLNTYLIKVKVGAGGSEVDTGVLWPGYARPRLCTLTNGFVVATESYDSDTGLSQIAAARYNNGGVLQGSVFQVNTLTNGYHFEASVAALSDGGFVIAWGSTVDDYDENGVFGRRYAANGTAVDAGEFEINEHRTGDQRFPVVAGMPNSQFVAVWTDAQATNFFTDVEARVLLPVAGPDTTPPAAPTSFIAVATGSDVVLSWVNPVDSDFASTTIRRSGSGYPATIADGLAVATGFTGTSLTNSSLSDGTYYYSIFARDTTGNWSVAAQTNATVDTTPPASPTSFIATVPSNRVVSMTWVNPTDPDFLNTMIRSSGSTYPATITDGGAVIIGATGTSQLDSGLAVDGTYYYSIFARDTAGNWSAPATAMVTIDTTAPAAPTAFTGVASGHNVTLSWVNPVSDFDSTAIDRFPANDVTNVTHVATGVTSTMLADNGVADGTYYYTIRARDAHGNWSVVATTTVVVGPPVITLGTNRVYYTLYQTPARLNPSGTFSAPSSPSFNGGTLTVTVVSNYNARDILGVRTNGLLGATSNSVSYNGTQIATYTGGTTGSVATVFTFNSNADTNNVQALINQVSFAEEDTAPTPTNFTRWVQLDFDDGAGMTSTPVSVQVVFNNAPSANLDRNSTGTNLSATISFYYLLKNDSDMDADPISLAGVDSVSANGGTVVSNATGVVYTPASDFAGLDTFTYVIQDGRSGLATGTVQVPVLRADEISLDEAPPQWGFTTNAANIGIMGIPGQSYRILATQNLRNQPVWTPIETNTLPSEGFARFFDHDATNHMIRFYRAVTP